MNIVITHSCNPTDVIHVCSFIVCENTGMGEDDIASLSFFHPYIYLQPSFLFKHKCLNFSVQPVIFKSILRKKERKI